MSEGLVVGETRGSDANVRKLVQHGTLPVYLTSGERIANMDKDIRELTGLMRASLTQKASEYGVRGFTLDEDAWEIAANGRTIVLTATIRRPQ